VTPKTNLASDLAPADQFDSFVARESSKFIEKHRDEPFFLVAGFLKPHAPFFPPRGFAEELYPPHEVALPDTGDLSGYPRHVQESAARFRAMGEDQLRRIRAGYLGNLNFVDSCIGEVYRTLEEQGLIDNTIVVYTSDHGEMCGDHGLFQKFVFFEPSVSVPLVVSYPKALPQGRVSSALVEYFGLYPTLLELAGLPPPDGIDAASFAALLRDPDRRGPDAAFAEYALSWAPRYMVRTDRYKYNFNDGDIPELYDLQADPGEMINRAGDSGLKQIQTDLHDRLMAWYDPAENAFRPESLKS
jgi:choline-sulfatase